MKNLAQLKTLMIASFIATVLFTTGFAQRGDDPTKVKTFKISGSGALFVESDGGGVVVEGSDRSNVKIMAYIHYKGKTLSADDPMLSELSEKFKVIMKKNGSEIVARVERSLTSMLWNQVGVSFTVFAPRNMSCELTSNGGGVDASGVSGTHEIESNGGGVNLEDMTGVTETRSHGGGVRVYNQDGKIKIVSSGGGVSLTDGKGDVYARSSGGSVRLENIDGRIDASSSGGAVRIVGTAPSVVAQSSGGSISMDISGLTKEVDLKTSGGGISAVIRDGKELGLDLDLKSQNVNIDLINFSGVAKKDRVEGKSNGGGIPVYMRTSGGSINVKFQ
ncbi:MAG: hypothetical protein ACJA2S_003670 [Cyclobacteriaceae bacterium]|jgi:hypothetical protein